MKIRELLDFLEQIAPLDVQEAYDNAGLLVGDDQSEIKGVLLCLDSTEAMVEEAIEKKCNLIVAHHPIIFSGLKSLTGSNYIQRTVISAIKNDIAIYAIHTNLDNVFQHGVNAKIAEKLSLQNTELLAPKKEDSALFGSGLIGSLANPMSERDFLEFLKSTMKTGCIKHTDFLGQTIERIGLCGGSGRFLLENAKRAGAQAFVSADFKYHEFFDADRKILIADIGHYESEQYTTDLLYELITNKFSNFAAYCTERVTNPVKYY